MMVVSNEEIGDDGWDVLGVAEDATVEGLFLEGAVGAFDHAGGLRLVDEGEARADAPEGLKTYGDRLRRTASPGRRRRSGRPLRHATLDTWRGGQEKSHDLARDDVVSVGTKCSFLARLRHRLAQEGPTGIEDRGGLEDLVVVVITQPL